MTALEAGSVPDSQLAVQGQQCCIRRNALLQRSCREFCGTLVKSNFYVIKESHNSLHPLNCKHSKSAGHL